MANGMNWKRCRSTPLPAFANPTYSSNPSTFNLRPSTLDLPTFDFPPPTSDVRPFTFNIQPLSFDFPPPTSDLRPSTFDFRLSTFDLRRSTFDLRLSTFNLQPFNFSTFQPFTSLCPTNHSRTKRPVLQSSLASAPEAKPHGDASSTFTRDMSSRSRTRPD